MPQTPNPQGNAALQLEIANAIANIEQTEGITPQALAQVLLDIMGSSWNNIDTPFPLPPVNMTTAQLATAIAASALNPFQWIQLTNRVDGNPLWVLAISTSNISPNGVWVVSGKARAVIMDYVNGYDGQNQPFIASYDSNRLLWLTQVTGKANAGINTILKAQASLTFGTVAAGTNSDQTVSVLGAAVGDPVILGCDPGTMGSGPYHCVAFVSATDTVTVRFINGQGSTSVTPPAGTFNITIIK